MKTNQPIDPLTIVHFTVCFIIGYIKLFNWPTFIVLATVWEVFEYYFARHNFSYIFEKYYPIPRRYWDEKSQNKIIDMIVNIAGYALGRYFAKNK